ncbi:MAG: preprotein translocase subunit YidC [Candidatus Berkelbacteria bacterium Licking1014_85]|uniref:Preprotein translocase subunit YidC n=1 Tax=Candidatus Berkelbacteria bacterium Licking1014_85 TaxID=2017148 RepID=A0A554LG79_9BACT|nr:MAG: preprotein translocase subunit YidC [Candidatus Berkelbacteria bacterium Licking1014_85]
MYKGDQKRISQETMALYKTYGVNPMGACIPILIQLPILIILYQVFIRGLSTDSFHNLYSWVPRPETLNTMFFGIDLTKPEKIWLPILTGISQFFQTWQIQPKAPPKSDDPMALMTKQMLYIFPIMTFFIARSLPAALPLYWLATNAFSIVQQTLIFKDKHKEITSAVKTITAENNKTKTISEEVVKSNKNTTITIRRKK